MSVFCGYFMKREGSFKNKSARIYFHERCGDDGRSDSRTFYSTLLPFYSNKLPKSSRTMQLLEADTLVITPADVANVMNPFYVNITSTIGYLVTEDILELDDDVITHSQTKYKGHPKASVKKILERHPKRCMFSFQNVDPECVQSIISHLEPHKATRHNTIPSKTHQNVRRLIWALCTRRKSSLIRKNTDI